MGYVDDIKKEKYDVLREYKETEYEIAEKTEKQVKKDNKDLKLKKDITEKENIKSKKDVKKV